MSRSNFEPGLLRLQVKIFAFFLPTCWVPNTVKDHSSSAVQKKRCPLLHNAVKKGVANKDMYNDILAIQQKISYITNQT